MKYLNINFNLTPFDTGSWGWTVHKVKYANAIYGFRVCVGPIDLIVDWETKR